MPCLILSRFACLYCWLSTMCSYSILKYYLEQSCSQFSKLSRKDVLPPSQIVSHLTFFTPSLTTHLIKKIVQI